MNQFKISQLLNVMFQLIYIVSSKDILLFRKQLTFKNTCLNSHSKYFYHVVNYVLVILNSPCLMTQFFIYQDSLCRENNAIKIITVNLYF